MDGKTLGLFAGLAASFAMLGLVVRGAKAGVKKTGDGRPISYFKDKAVAPPKVESGKVVLELGKKYLIGGEFPNESGTFRVIFTPSNDSLQTVPGELEILDFPNRVITVQEIVRE
jgi:hypothetical protein